MASVMIHNSTPESLPCPLLASDRLDCTCHGSQALLDSELARENALLRQQLLKAAADSDAIAQSLKEQVQSSAETNDAKVCAEAEAKMLQVQLKSLQKELDAHKYELHVVRKQLQIGNEEKEQHRKQLDASYKQHLLNVKKLARFESECQRLRNLIRHRLPGPAVIAQMRAECNVHVQMNLRKRSSSALSSSSAAGSLIDTSPRLEAQREMQTLKEKLLFVEDESKVLKEAMARRTAELREARQLCARTAMQLSAAQACIESIPSKANTACVAPVDDYSQGESFFLDADHRHGSTDQDMSISDSDCMLNTENALDASCHNMHEGSDSATLQLKSELKDANHGGADEKLDELNCAESWASALVAELCHLSNFQEGSSAPAGDGPSPPEADEQMVETSNSNTDNINLDDENVQGMETYQALEIVEQRLSSVGGKLLKSVVDDLDSSNADSPSRSACDVKPCNSDSSVHGDRMHASIMLKEIAQIKSLLLDISRAMGMVGNGYVENTSFGQIKTGEFVCQREGLVKRASQRWDYGGSGKRGLSRLRINSLDSEENMSGQLNGDEIVTKLGEEFDEGGAKCRDQIAGMENSLDIIATDIESKPSSDIADSDVKADDINVCKGSAKFSEHGEMGSSQLNLAEEVADERSELEAMERMLREAQAELERARGRIAALEAELARCRQEKADVDNEVSALKKELEAELAHCVSKVDDLNRQLSVEITDENVILSTHCNMPLLREEPQPTNLNPSIGNIKEALGEEDLVVTSAPLGDYQSNVANIQQQMSHKIHDSTIQDVIIDNQQLYDSCSESLKSMEQSLGSPPSTCESILIYNSSSVKFTEAEHVEDKLTQQVCNKSFFPNLRVSKSLQDGENSSWFIGIDGQITKQQALQCKPQDVRVKFKLFRYLTRSFSKPHTTKPYMSLSKAPKPSPRVRLLEFFNRPESPS